MSVIRGYCFHNSAPMYGTSYPAASAYVTAVGGTGVQQEDPSVAHKTRGWPNAGTAVTEKVISSGTHEGITSGGGFAATVPTPRYQQAHVAAYVQRTGTDNISARGYPDVAGLAGNIMIVQGGSTYHSGGTSASSPFFAGLINIINSELLLRGSGPLGFLNPLLCKDLDVHSCRLLGTRTFNPCALASAPRA